MPALKRYVDLNEGQRPGFCKAVITTTQDPRERWCGNRAKRDGYCERCHPSSARARARFRARKRIEGLLDDLVDHPLPVVREVLEERSDLDGALQLIVDRAPRQPLGDVQEAARVARERLNAGHRDDACTILNRLAKGLDWKTGKPQPEDG